MDLASVQWLGVLVTTVVVFVSGMAWFSRRAFFPVWWRAMGRTDTPGGDGSMPLIFGLTLVGIVLQATAMALLFGLIHQGSGDIDQLTGLLVGLVVGLAVAAAALGHRLFAGHGLLVWSLEVGNDILNFVIAGLLLSFWY